MTMSDQTTAPVEAPQQPNERDDPLARDILLAARYYLGGRRALIVMLALAAAAGLALNWSWLVAVGLAPILIGILPCAVMCGLGLCMNRLMGRSCESDAQQVGLPLSNSGTSALPEVIESSASPAEAADTVASISPQPEGDDHA